VTRKTLVSLALLGSGLACEPRGEAPTTPDVRLSVAKPVFSSMAGRNERGAFEVGPGRKFADLHSVAPLLSAGDVVEVIGGATYRGGVRFTRDGAAGRPITIRGVIVNGKRPIIQGEADTIEVRGDHYVIENLEISGATRRCFFHHSHDVVIRNVFIHDCRNGLLGADDNSGSLTIEGSEFARCGEGIRHHQIYMATDEKAHPGSLFVLRQSFIHDGVGGNNVKSRAERNLIAMNWIEGALYHEVELVGPDGQDPDLAREDGEVIGNVLRKTNEFHAVRIGGDGTGDTAGRYRFVNNTFIMAGSAGAIRLQDRVESIELYNNLFVREGALPVTLFRDETVLRPPGEPSVIGDRNWFSAVSDVPTSLTATKTGPPDLQNMKELDFRPRPSSPLRGAGTRVAPTNAKTPLNALAALPQLEPPARVIATGSSRDAARARPAQGPISIGALEP